jgi:Ca2+-binding EF-hand superfamily protein
MDKDKNGVISLQELRVAFESSVLQGQEFSLSRDDIESMFSDLEVDSDVQINYSEFLAAAMSKQLCVEEERLQVAFRSLDLEGRGYLTRDSIRLALGQDKKDAGSLLDALVNMNVSSAEDDSVERKIDSVFDELDFNKDGKIEFYEFLKYWRNFNCDKHASIRSKFSKAIKSVLSGFGVISKMSKKSS